MLFLSTLEGTCVAGLIEGTALMFALEATDIGLGHSLDQQQCDSAGLGCAFCALSSIALPLSRSWAKIV